MRRRRGSQNNHRDDACVIDSRVMHSVCQRLCSHERKPKPTQTTSSITPQFVGVFARAAAPSISLRRNVALASGKKNAEASMYVLQSPCWHCKKVQALFIVSC